MPTQRREYLNSPLFRTQYTSLSSGEEKIIDYEATGTQSEKYAPLNYLRVVNNTGNTISVYINQADTPMLVAPDTERTADKKSFPAINSVKVVNEDDAFTSSESLTVEAQREAEDTDSLVQRGVNWFLGVGEDAV